MTLEQAGRVLHFPEEKVNRLLKAGDLRGRTLKGQTLVAVASVWNVESAWWNTGAKT
jgi:hypothetical protein